MEKSRYDKIFGTIVELRKNNDVIINTDEIMEKLEKDQFSISREDLNGILYDLECFNSIEYTTNVGYVLGKDKQYQKFLKTPKKTEEEKTIKNETNPLAKYLTSIVQNKIETLKKEKQELERKFEGLDKTSEIQMKIKLLTDLAEGKIDMNKAKILAKKLKKIDNKIEYLKKKKDETQKELGKYPLLQSILFALM